MQSSVSVIVLLALLTISCANAPETGSHGQSDRLEKEWMRRVERLAGQERPARGLGEPGLEIAGIWIASEFEKIGLERVNDRYLQEFSALMPDGGQERIFNVLGRLPATREGGGQILVSAHYDSLNTEDGVRFPGADDNASGVATLLALAEGLSRVPEREHEVVFVAFTAEEDGFVGSQYFVDHAEELPDLAIVLDMVGRLEDGRIFFDASEPEIEESLGRQIVSRKMTWATLGGLDRSDALPFRAAGVGTLVLSSGFHADYHQPGDTVDRLRVRDAIRIYDVLLEFLAGMITNSEERLRRARH